jgi:hypothetical protein
MLGHRHTAATTADSERNGGFTPSNNRRPRLRSRLRSRHTAATTADSERSGGFTYSHIYMTPPRPSLRPRYNHQQLRARRLLLQLKLKNAVSEHVSLSHPL